MSNSFITTDKVLARTVLEAFRNKFMFKRGASINMEREYTAGELNIGSTIKMRRPLRVQITEGQTSTPQPMKDEVEALTLEKIFNAHIEYDSPDKLLKMRRPEIAKRFIKPTTDRLLNKVDKYIAEKAKETLYQSLGTSSTNISAYSDYSEISQYAEELGIPLQDGGMFAMKPKDKALIKNSLQNMFNERINEKITERGYIGKLDNYELYSSANIYKQTAGTPGAGPVTTSSAVSSGSSIPVSGVATGTSTVIYRKGDIIRIAAADEVYSVNYVDGSINTSKPMTFVVTADVLGNGTANNTIPVSPEIVTSGAHQNVSKAIPNGATIEHEGDHNVNIVFDENALMFAVPPLKEIDIPHCGVYTDPQTGFSIFYGRQGNLNNLSNQLRLSIFCGAHWNPQYAIRYISQV